VPLRKRAVVQSPEARSTQKQQAARKFTRSQATQCKMLLATLVASISFAPQSKSVALVALGCPKNTVDAEVMLGDLQRSGLRVVKEPKQADIVIVNTCAFVEDAKRESIAAVIEAAGLKQDRDVPACGLFVTGCLAQRYADELATELPEVDAVVGFEHYADLPTQVLELLARQPETPEGAASALDAISSGHVTSALPKVMVGSNTIPFRSEEDRHQLTSPHYAYIRVAEGCDHACTFCAIPGFRGEFRSKPFDVVLAEAERLVENGVRELNLIAEDTNQYGSDWGEADERRLADLLHALAAIPSLKWIRLLYCYPSYFSEELIDAIAGIDKVCKYIDIPLQHLSSSVLARMRRPGGAGTVALLKKLRERIPNLTLRTTFISGFPGETDAEHRELVQLASELGFERGGAFAYSAEDGTPAAEMDDQIDDDVREARRDELIALFQDHASDWAEAQVGRELNVIIDRMEGLDAIGRTEGDAPDIDGSVRLPEAVLAPGTQLKVRVIAADVMELVAEPLV
jgi:ribosomal protein S12 methylthiotransferase